MSSAEFNPYAAPEVPLTPTIVSTAEDVWRSGNLLVVRRESVLPDRCVRCNEPAEEYRLKKTFYWHNPLIYILILISLLLYIIVALIVRRSMPVSFGLCPLHRAKRKQVLFIGWAIGLGGIGLAVAGAAEQPFNTIMFCIGLGLTFVSLIYGIIARQTITPKRIDDTFARFKGCGYAYLAELAEWDGI